MSEPASAPSLGALRTAVLALLLAVLWCEVHPASARAAATLFASGPVVVITRTRRRQEAPAVEVRP